MTRKPCPGCGGTTHPRKADEVCQVCKYKLDRYVDLDREERFRRAEDVRLEEQRKRELVHVLVSARWVPDGQKAGVEWSSTVLVRLASLLGPAWGKEKNSFTVVRYVPRKSEPCNASIRTPRAQVRVTPEVYEALADLRDAIQADVDQARAEGVVHGRSLLAQLAAGEITMADVDGSRRT